MTELKVQKAAGINVASIIEDCFKPIGTTEEVFFNMSDRDDKYLILVRKSSGSDGDVTIKAGDGIQGVCDLVIPVDTVAANCAVTIESGRFKNVSGENKEKVILKASDALYQIIVLCQP